MKTVEPKVFLIGKTIINEDSTIDEDGLQDFLEHIGVPNWDTDAPTDGEKLMEVYGRLCYNSFAPGLNPNVTKVRQGNASYIDHLFDSKHGSVAEHIWLNFILADVSRVFTHELVRHRVGVAISQESLRYVRSDELSFWLPLSIRKDEHVVAIFGRTFEQLELLQKELVDHLGLNQPEMRFSQKKVLTSAIRRLIPQGMATNIGWSANIRTLRHIIEIRTHPAAEEEMRLVFGKVGEICCRRFPNAFSDFTITTEGDPSLPRYTPIHSKV